MIIRAFKEGDKIPEAARYLFFSIDRNSGSVSIYFLVPEDAERD